MKRASICWALLLALSSCAGNSSGGPTQPPSDAPQSPPRSAPQTPGAVPSDLPAYHSQSNDQPVAPKGAQYTIFCSPVRGELHVAQANRLRDELKAKTGMKDWYAIHQGDQSLLYYGYYRTINDPKDPKEMQRAQTDRAKIEAMSDGVGNRPFRQALFVPLDAPDPIAPPEWNILNTDGAYTLQIAVYKGSPERKQAAVDAVRAARAQGVQAYYYHGDISSSVCIGSWPESAVRSTDMAAEARHGDPMQPLMVVPQSNDPSLNQHYDDIARQSGARLVQPKTEILDPTLLAMLQRYPTNTVNGLEQRRVVEGQQIVDPSLVIRIPREAAPIPAFSPPQVAGSGSESPGYDANYMPNIPRAVDPPSVSASPASGTGRLRSIGD